jgi:hypothetical protein
MIVYLSRFIAVKIAEAIGTATPLRPHKTEIAALSLFADAAIFNISEISALPFAVIRPRPRPAVFHSYIAFKFARL